MAVTRSQTAKKKKHSADEASPALSSTPDPTQPASGRMKPNFTPSSGSRLLKPAKKPRTGKKVFPYLEIPSEVRNQIYTLTLVQEAINMSNQGYYQGGPQYAPQYPPQSYGGGYPPPQQQYGGYPPPQQMQYQQGPPQQVVVKQKKDRGCLGSW
ncbi:hypothetical protein B0A49_07219 [Cryomyces minteri]|uniref:Uncharacterized protein n=2 Tax=Cryomyces minteri TaxID=331657 RepID=A0A4U0WUW9_9PEZI|nr:hypothetical protein B0A49_07219 [Cryomyces minteri]